MSDLGTKLQLGLAELAAVREDLTPLIALPADMAASTIQRAAACAMLHSFYTEIEKILKRIALEYDGSIPDSDSWHKELLNQISQPTSKRPAVISGTLAELLGEFLAFRHLFRGASIVLMRWEKLAPLLAKVGVAYEQTCADIKRFMRFIEGESAQA